MIGRGFAGLLLMAAVRLGIAAPVPAHAQVDRARTPPALFDSDQPLELTLTTDLKAVLKDRGKDRAYHGALLSYAGPDGTPASLAIRVRTRGIFRLSPAHCQFPPLALEFAAAGAAGTLFAGQRRLKLVTHCLNRQDRYEQYVVQEYLVYRTYNLLTDRSFRVRLARLTYVDSAGRDAPLTKYGFLIEDERQLAARNRAVAVREEGLYQDDIEVENMGLVAVFQYMIGNTDWSVWRLHNIVLLRDSGGGSYAVPYDFDWSGVVSAVYAKPDSRLPIRSVRERLFRGACRTPAEFAALFGQFQAKRDAIYTLYRNAPGLSAKGREQALRYYDEFYETIGDPVAIKREFLRACGNRT